MSAISDEEIQQIVQRVVSQALGLAKPAPPPRWNPPRRENPPPKQARLPPGKKLWPLARITAVSS